MSGWEKAYEEYRLAAVLVCPSCQDKEARIAQLERDLAALRALPANCVVDEWAPDTRIGLTEIDGEDYS